MLYRGRRLRVVVGQKEARYELIAGEPLELSHHGEAITVEQGTPVTRELPSFEWLGPIEQPPGRAPSRRHTET